MCTYIGTYIYIYIYTVYTYIYIYLDTPSFTRTLPAHCFSLDVLVPVVSDLAEEVTGPERHRGSKEVNAGPK